MKTIFLSAFYSYLLPHGLFIGVLALVISYWVDKWALIYRYARPQQQLGGELAHSMRNMLELTMPIACTGAFLFEQDLYGKNGSWMIIS